MNGEGNRGEEKIVKMEEDVKEKKIVFMWGYLPGALPQRSPLLSPVMVRLPGKDGTDGQVWRDVCGGGCGFAMAISASGKLITWGSTDDLGQSYVTSGKHGATPEPFPLPSEVSIVKAAAGWAHCAAITDRGEVYTWGWKECVPSGKIFGDLSVGTGYEKDVFDRQSSFVMDPVSPRLQDTRSTGAIVSNIEARGGGAESTKRRRVSSAKLADESLSSSDDTVSALPCLVTLNPGVRIASVSAGGRHTLALSDMGQVWGWGYGGEGQLGLGSRIRMVSSPHPIPCIESSSFGKDRTMALARGSASLEGEASRIPGSYVKGIACGGRHSAAITDAGALLMFGWGLYGQCGQGCTDDELSPTCVSSLLGIRIESVAAGLWHTVCISADGDVYSFGGNQFGQLGTGADQAETLPRLLDTPSVENVNAKLISCGARHSAIVTDNGKVFCWGWNKYGQPCITRLPENGFGRNVTKWPARLHTPPDRLQTIQYDAYIFRNELFRAESKYWNEIIGSYVRALHWKKIRLRNVMDMRAGFGGFAAALIDHKLDSWVMNVVPVSGPNTLPVIYDRGLLGVLHDWCEPFDTYPRTYDLLHAAGLFSSMKSMSTIMLEMDRILRPGGRAYIRDNIAIMDELQAIGKAMGWRVTLRDTSEASHASYRILIGEKRLLRS